MARKSMFEKVKRKPKFQVRAYNRCPLCGRSRGYMRRFDMCRICFRENASKGLIPGISKSSW
ncbi:MAG: type Z 30S ribosomal protein S14 [Leptospiraceae bacterium]|nr:type Z 30S ribosomal protein S14 [Leptospiraceae bacterium]MCB1202048.1 type Z 30S ribosomal protein S14 [Leptospiraceae bacterium]